MKINSIKVTKLFGVFDHEVPINNETGITIIIGENGLGKTVFLEMIEAFFRGNYLHFNDVNFEELIFFFDDGIKWILTKKNSTNRELSLSLTQINKNKSRRRPISLIEYDEEQADFLAHRIRRNYPHLKNIGPNFWLDRRTGEKFPTKELMYRYGHHIQRDLFSQDGEKPKWFSDKYDKIDVSLIETQRLISTNIRDENRPERTVEKYSRELSQTIKRYLTESTELSSKLDRTYPNRLIERLKKTTNLTEEDLNKELKRLEAKRETLDAVGLIEIEKDSSMLEIANPGNEIVDVLMLYVEDSFKKIEIFDNLSRKIEIFLDTINKRFKHKKLIIDKDKGFLFKSTIIKDSEGNFQQIPVTK